ncbi:MAG: bifunctional hydroxymethylpyrimidine kinase/phosphomethylpyrimidine kinase [Acidobacteria bacterium]|nr:bifunctional hydroxymethylpyrimidine kinase/phosphomethylpyrimidine kinase [Acidobacteriota bacterium]
MNRTVMSIAGWDPSAGAGVAADLKTIAAFGHYGVGVITSVTAQNTTGIQAIYDLPMEFIAQQIESLHSDIDIHAVKVGMLGTARAATIVASLIHTLRLENVVVDPVLRSTSGTSLLEKKAISVLREKIFPLAAVVTPNMEEASALTGARATDVRSMKEAARALVKAGARAAVVTGGHLGPRAIDILYDGRKFSLYDSTMIPTTNTHGVGCTFATAVACLLARGTALPEAVDEAKRYVARAVNHPYKIGKGDGPLHHVPAIA